MGGVFFKVAETIIQETHNPGNRKLHYKLAIFSRRQKPMCLLGENFQYGLLGEKACNFIMILSSGEPQPIFSNVA